MSAQEIAWLLQEKYNGQKTEGFLADCDRLEAGEPLAYVIGHIPFLGCTINLDNQPLIPRSETEHWTELAIESIKHTTIKTPRVLDLCAGSGSIGVAIACALPAAQVTFVEIDTSLHSTIERNLRNNLGGDTKSFNEYYHIHSSDLFINVSGTFDFILSNPPYIDAAANTVAANVVRHEPHLALFGGTDGMEIITRIIAEAASHLSPNGQLWIEHEPAQTAHIATLATTYNWTCVTKHDQYHIERYSILTQNVSK